MMPWCWLSARATKTWTTFGETCPTHDPANRKELRMARAMSCGLFRFMFGNSLLRFYRLNPLSGHNVRLEYRTYGQTYFFRRGRLRNRLEISRGGGRQTAARGLRHLSGCTRAPGTQFKPLPVDPGSIDYLALTH